MKSDKKPIIVLDANAFISSGHLLNLAANHRLVTIPQVIDELKDQVTRQKIKNFPFEIQKKSPSKKSINAIKQFAKKTGDIGSLSDVDISVLAIVYQLYVNQGLQHLIKRQPQPIKRKNVIEKQQGEEISQQQQEQYEQEYEQQQQQEQEQITQKHQQQTVQIQQQKEEVKQEKNEQDDDGWQTVPIKKKQLSDSEQSDMSDNEGWVTPSNYGQKMAEINTICDKGEDQCEKVEVTEAQSHVSIMTTDFAMQNVAVQMGLKLLSLDGRKINSIRRFVWQCYLCWKQYKIQDNVVKNCTNCGYNSLSKIAYSIDSQGHMIMHRKKGWKPNKKVLQWKQRKLQQQQKRKKHQHNRRKKQPSIFETS